MTDGLFDGAPADWRRIRLKFTVDSVIGGVWGEEPAGEQSDAICVRVADFDYGSGTLKRADWTRRSFTPGQLRSRLLAPGDLLLEKSGGGEQQPVGRVVRVAAHFHGQAVFSNFIARLRPVSGFDAEYLQFLHHALYVSGITRLSIKQTTGIQNLDTSRYLAQWVCVPPLQMQRQIAGFLRKETRRLSVIAEGKRRLLDLIDEREAALVEQHVGWDALAFHPNVRLMHLVNSTRPVMYGIVLPGPDVDDGVVLVKGGDVEASRLRPELLSRTAREIEQPFARARLAAGDLLVSIRGSFGAVAEVPAALAGANITQDAARVAPAAGVSTRWLYHSLRSRTAYEQMAAAATGATIRGVNIRDLKRVELRVPPLDIQKGLAAALDRAATHHDALRATLRRQLALLDEHRDAVVASVIIRGLPAAGVDAKTRRAA